MTISKIKLLPEKTPALISFDLSLKFSTKQELFPRSEMQDLNHAWSFPLLTN